MERQNRETSENGTARPYQRPRYVRREERSENGERQEYRPRAPRFNERRFQEPRNYNQNNREEEQRQEPRQEAGQEMRTGAAASGSKTRDETGTASGNQHARQRPGGLRHPRGHAGRIWIYPLRQLYAGRQRCLRFPVPNPPFRTENGRYHPRKHESKVRNRKFSALLYLKSVNNLPLDQIMRRGNFEDMTPVFPDERLRLERRAEAWRCGSWIL